MQDIIVKTHDTSQHHRHKSTPSSNSKSKKKNNVRCFHLSQKVVQASGPLGEASEHKCKGAHSADCSTGVIVGAILPRVARVLLGSPPASLEQGVQLVATFTTRKYYDEKHENFKHGQNAFRTICPENHKRYVIRPRNCACTFCSILPS